MGMLLRESQHSDLPFLREMLYDAVFWRASVNKPSFEEGLAYPDVSKSLADWGERNGDTAVVATMNSIPIGASWFRFWTDDNYVNGYTDENTPVVVLGLVQRLLCGAKPPSAQLGRYAFVWRAFTRR
jgi:hypothetical protein